MSGDERDFRIRPGRIRQTPAPRQKTFINQVLRAACLPHAPGSVLLGASCDAALARSSSMLLSLPAWSACPP